MDGERGVGSGAAHTRRPLQHASQRTYEHAAKKQQRGGACFGPPSATATRTRQAHHQALPGQVKLPQAAAAPHWTQRWACQRNFILEW